MMTFLLVVLAIVLVWNMIPNVLIWTVDIPTKDKFKAMKCFMFSAFPRGLMVFIPDILAPIVVPIALLFTKREDDKLPKLFEWWDNDVSINGDQPQYWPLDYDGVTYYANAHPRSFKARYVWLGLRNRASRAAQMAGYNYPNGVDDKERRVFGDIATGRDHEGWVVNNLDDIYQLYIVKKISSKMCIRINYGFKIWEKPQGRTTAMVVNIGFSALSYKGTE